MNAVMDDAVHSIFEFAVDFHTPGWLKFGNLELQPVFLYLITGNLELPGIVMPGSIIPGALKAP